ncbi:MAG: LysR family transcriptional regulator [[Clostridium] scindens]
MTLVSADAGRRRYESRYYAKPLNIRGVKYVLCSQWFEKESNNDRPYLLRWIKATGNKGSRGTMTIQQLRYVIKIVECGSITEAARQFLHISAQPFGGSEELETELGIEIFHRTTRGIRCLPTYEFLSYARQILRTHFAGTALFE